MIASATAADYGRVLELVLADPGVDAVISLFARRSATRAQDVADAIDAVAALPVAAATAGPGGLPRRRPADAASARRARRAGASPRRRRPRARSPTPSATPAAARRRRIRRRELDGPRPRPGRGVVSPRWAPGGGWLPPDEVEALLGAFGLPVARSRQVETPREAAHAAAELGGPVALKALAPGLLHKSDAARCGSGWRARPRSSGPRARSPRPCRRPVIGSRASSSRRWRPEGTELSSASSAIRRSGRSSRVGAGGTTAELIRRHPGAARAAGAPRGGGDDPRRCGRSRCSTATAARRSPTSPPWKTWCCACPRWPPRTRRSPSSTATR